VRNKFWLTAIKYNRTWAVIGYRFVYLPGCILSYTILSDGNALEVLSICWQFTDDVIGLTVKMLNLHNTMHIWCSLDVNSTKQEAQHVSGTLHWRLSKLIICSWGMHRFEIFAFAK